MQHNTTIEWVGGCLANNYCMENLERVDENNQSIHPFSDGTGTLVSQRHQCSVCAIYMYMYFWNLLRNYSDKVWTNFPLDHCLRNKKVIVAQARGEIPQTNLPKVTNRRLDRCRELQGTHNDKLPSIRISPAKIPAFIPQNRNHVYFFVNQFSNQCSMIMCYKHPALVLTSYHSVLPYCCSLPFLRSSAFTSATCHSFHHYLQHHTKLLLERKVILEYNIHLFSCKTVLTIVYAVHVLAGFCIHS